MVKKTRVRTWNCGEMKGTVLDAVRRFFDSGPDCSILGLIEFPSQKEVSLRELLPKHWSVVMPASKSPKTCRVAAAFDTRLFCFEPLKCHADVHQHRIVTLRSVKNPAVCVVVIHLQRCCSMEDAAKYPMTVLEDCMGERVRIFTEKQKVTDMCAQLSDIVRSYGEDIAMFMGDHNFEIQMADGKWAHQCLVHNEVNNNGSCRYQERLWNALIGRNQLNVHMTDCPTFEKKGRRLRIDGAFTNQNALHLLTDDIEIDGTFRSQQTGHHCIVADINLEVQMSVYAMHVQGSNDDEDDRASSDTSQSSPSTLSSSPARHQRCEKLLERAKAYRQSIVKLASAFRYDITRLCAQDNRGADCRRMCDELLRISDVHISLARSMPDH